VVDPLTRLRLDYAPIMLRYLAQEDETGLQAAYELGRTAMLDSVSLLEVVRVHNETFLEVHGSARDVEESQRLAGAAAALLLELVAAFEMAQRGFMESRQPPTPA
jgi:hypothetical protein